MVNVIKVHLELKLIEYFILIIPERNVIKLRLLIIKSFDKKQKSIYPTALGPFIILIGNVIILLSRSKTALTVIPINLNGKSNNQTIG